MRIQPETANLEFSRELQPRRARMFQPFEEPEEELPASYNSQEAVYILYDRNYFQSLVKKGRDPKRVRRVLDELLEDLKSKYLYAPAAFQILAKRKVSEFLPVESDVALGELFFVSKHSYDRRKLEAYIEKRGLPAKLTENALEWYGEDLEELLEFLEDAVWAEDMNIPIVYRGKNPELICSLDPSPWRHACVRESIASLAEKFGFETEVCDEGVKLYIDEKNKLERLPLIGKVVKKAKAQKVAKKMVKFYEAAVRELGYVPNVVVDENTAEILRKKGLVAKESRVGEDVVVKLRAPRERLWLKVISLGFAIGTIGSSVAATYFYAKPLNKTTTLDSLLANWSDASNNTKLEAWAHYIFHDLNGTWDGTLDGNMSWLTPGNQLFMQYFAGNFTDAAGEPAFTNKTLFDTYFQLVNNATERLNGRVLARWIAGVEEFGNDSAHLNGVTGWGIIDPIEFRTAAILIKAEPRLADYGNLTMVLAEANATHDGINASEIQTLSSIVDAWENFTWTERRYLEIGLHPVNKSFQWKERYNLWQGMYYYEKKPVNDTGDFLWRLWLNSTARGILGNDLLANKTLFWYAATFNKFLDKGEWNGLWRDEKVYELTLNWIKFFGPSIKAAMSLPNATIAIRKYPCIYGTSNIDQGFNETFIDPYRNFNVTVNGTTYQINGLLQDVHKTCWGPNRTVDWRAKIGGKKLGDALWELSLAGEDINNGGSGDGAFPGNITNATRWLWVPYKLAHDGNSSNDVKRPMECADTSVLASLIALASPMVVDTNGIVRNETEATGIPLSALVAKVPGHADIYGTYVNGSARLVFGFINVNENTTWQAPMFGRIRWHGPDTFTWRLTPSVCWKEGVGPSWNYQIPPGEPYSHYDNETIYTKKMPVAHAGIYHDEVLIREDFSSIMKKYDLYNMNVTADQRVADYPAVPELKYLVVLPPILGYQFYRAKVWKRLRRGFEKRDARFVRRAAGIVL